MNVLTSIPQRLALTSWEHYILVIEDDPEVRDSYRSALRAAGFAAVGVEGCFAAIRLTEFQPPCAIIVDLSLPGLDGGEVQRVLKSNPQTRDVPVVVITGTDIRDLNLKDVACVLRTPVTVETLVAAVRQTVSQVGPGVGLK
jgi:CheY-like chemotaxis protein